MASVGELPGEVMNWPSVALWTACQLATMAFVERGTGLCVLNTSVYSSENTERLV
jgi:hypothetical protein